MLGRRVWSDPEVQKYAREYLCVAEEVWNLVNRDFPAAKFFREYGRQVPPKIWNAGSTTKQGVYLMSPDGDYLGAHFARHGKADTIRLLQEGLKRWKEVVAKRNYRPKKIPAKDPSWMWSSGEVAPRCGGKLGDEAELILQVVSRDLPGADGKLPGDPRYHGMWNLTWLEFTGEDMLGFLPRGGKKGTVPESLVRKLGHDNLVDNVRGQQNDRWRDEDILRAEMTTERVSRRGDVLTVRLQGVFEAKRGGQAYRATLHGKAEFDAGAKRFRMFELVAVGVREGSSRFNFRKDDPPSLLGFAFIIENQYERKSRKRPR